MYVTQLWLKSSQSETRILGTPHTFSGGGGGGLCECYFDIIAVCKRDYGGGEGGGGGVKIAKIVRT